MKDLEHELGIDTWSLNDDNGLYYTILSHTWVFQGGYPHWKTNTKWDQNPPAIANDKFAIKWTRDLYFCNGPKSTPTIPLYSLVLLPSDESLPRPRWELSSYKDAVQNSLTREQPLSGVMHSCILLTFGCCSLQEIHWCIPNLHTQPLQCPQNLCIPWHRFAKSWYKKR